MWKNGKCTDLKVGIYSPFWYSSVFKIDVFRFSRSEFSVFKINVGNSSIFRKNISNNCIYWCIFTREKKKINAYYHMPLFTPSLLPDSNVGTLQQWIVPLSPTHLTRLYDFVIDQNIHYKNWAGIVTFWKVTFRFSVLEEAFPFLTFKKRG